MLSIEHLAVNVVFKNGVLKQASIQAMLIKSFGVYSSAYIFIFVKIGDELNDGIGGLRMIVAGVTDSDESVSKVLVGAEKAR